MNIQQELNAASKAMQQINFTGNLIRRGGAIMYIIIEKAKKNSFRFFKRNSWSTMILFRLNKTLRPNGSI